jgi:hypothetical protein
MRLKSLLCAAARKYNIWMARPTPEKLGYWYLRLNGFMTMESFVLHSDSRREPGQRTDADIYGVRFPFRRELTLADDILFQIQAEKPMFIIGEIKRGECALNGPWTDPSKRNMQYLLQAIGSFEAHQVENIATALYENLSCEDSSCNIQMVTIGSSEIQEYRQTRPALPQLLFSTMLSFIYRRFRDFHRQKKDHQQ